MTRFATTAIGTAAAFGRTRAKGRRVGHEMRRPVQERRSTAIGSRQELCATWCRLTDGWGHRKVRTALRAG